jgi:uncharacterized cupin superfamily protein
MSEKPLVINVRDAQWRTHPTFGSSCRFESPEEPFPEYGINVRVLGPGQPNGLYHRESRQEDFLVLAGECLLLVDGEERRLGPWDFVHCPAGTDHIFVGAGEGPCIILMVGGRVPDQALFYPVSELAQRHGAGATAETDSPEEAYASFERPKPGRPEGWDRLPWAR